MSTEIWCITSFTKIPLYQVINRGDSFKRKERGGPPISRPSIEISVDGCPEERVPRHFEKVYRVVFMGSTEVIHCIEKKEITICFFSRSARHQL